jgi:hypothetical protein
MQVSADLIKMIKLWPGPCHGPGRQCSITATWQVKHKQDEEEDYEFFFLKLLKYDILKKPNNFFLRLFVRQRDTLSDCLMFKQRTYHLLCKPGHF